MLYQKAFEKEKEKNKTQNNSSKLNAIHAAIKTENYDNAELWLGQVIYVAGTPSDYKLYYAACLGLNDKCDLGLDALNKFEKDYSNDARIIYLKPLFKLCDFTNFDWRKIMIDEN